ncbi:50S ribosomal protein L4, partial [Streptomyces sp. NPDC058307]|uniref:50S ribosomal protein L4 n=1 Tax=Streptomyces sp. NPDC058307 TaxID=3346439 RepID=UPI0036ECE5A4
FTAGPRPHPPTPGPPNTPTPAYPGADVGAPPATKAAKTLFGKISERKNLLLVIDRADEAAWLSARNLPQVHILEPGQLNTYDVLVSDDVVFTQAAFESFVSGPKAADTEGSEA